MQRRGDEHTITPAFRQCREITSITHAAARQEPRARERLAQRREELQVQADTTPDPAHIQHDQRCRSRLDRRFCQDSRIVRSCFRDDSRPREGHIVPEVEAECHLHLCSQGGQVGQRLQRLEPNHEVTACAAKLEEVGERGHARIQQQRAVEARHRAELRKELVLHELATDGVEVGHVTARHTGNAPIGSRQGQRVTRGVGSER